MTKARDDTGAQPRRRIGMAAMLGLGAMLALQAAPVAAQSAGDRPETGLQGQTLAADVTGNPFVEPFHKGVRIVGHNDLGCRDSNLQLAWIDRCAYVASIVPIPGLPVTAEKALDPRTSGVAVLDVSDAANPKQVGLLQDKGSIRAAETMSAVVAPGRRVLVAGDYEARGPSNEPWLDVYDASTCTRPKLMSEFKWPEKVHEAILSPNGKRVYATVISPFDGKGGLLVLDISDLAHPRYLGKFPVTRADGTSHEFAPHELSISPDERRLYVGVINSRGGDLNQGIKAKGVSPEILGPEAGGIYIIDNGDIVAGRPDPKLRLIATVQHGGWHSAVQARIGGRPYLVGAGELEACPGSWPRISDISDERQPRIVGQFRLAMNLKENCPPRTGMEASTGGIIAGPGTATSHYNDVDSATRTRMGLFPFLYSGLRIADLRDPTAPVEVAYFKPGDPCMSHVRYEEKSGQIWLDCLQSGFWVLELKPEVRAALGFPRLSGSARRR